MPPNVTNSPSGTDQQVRNRKGLVNGKTEDTIQECKQERPTQPQKSSILVKILNFLLYFSVFLIIFIAAFIFLPWEEYLFTDAELEDYISQYTQGTEEGDWVVRQFLATAEQNLTEPM